MSEECECKRRVGPLFHCLKCMEQCPECNPPMLSEEALEDLLAKAEAAVIVCGVGPLGDEPYIAQAFEQAAQPGTIVALVREVLEARAAPRCETCKRPLNGWCEPLRTP